MCVCGALQGAPHIYLYDTNQPEETTEVTLRYKKLNEQTERLKQPHEKTATLKEKEVQISKTSAF